MSLCSHYITQYSQFCHSISNEIVAKDPGSTVVILCYSQVTLSAGSAYNTIKNIEDQKILYSEFSMALFLVNKQPEYHWYWLCSEPASAIVRSLVLFTNFL